jgi:glutathione S-transferase
MAEYLDVEQARKETGLRLVLSVGVPGPWGESAKGLFHVKGIPYLRVRQDPGQPNEALVAWTGQSNAPQAILEDERPRTSWTEMIFLAERLAPDPPLLPADPEERALLFGLGFAICGEEGFGWLRRLAMIHQVASLPLDVIPEAHPARQIVNRLGRRYGYSAAAAEAAPRRAAEILALLASRLEAQRARGSEYFIGSSLTALDIYWAAFAALISPLPEEKCAMPAVMRSQYELGDPVILAAAAPILLEHRDLVYERHLELPIQL